MRSDGIPPLLHFDATGFPSLGGQPLTLPPKERAVLRWLVEQAPGVVSKDAFAAAAWPGGGMSDESLARCISRIRRALAPHGLRVEAVYGTGYRLLDERPAGRGGAVEAPQPDPAAAPAVPAQTLEAYEHSRHLLQKRTPVAVSMAIALLRDMVGTHPAYAAARIALAEGLAAAVGWGQLPTLEAVDEGLRVLAAVPPAAQPQAGLAAARGALLDMAWRFDEAGAAFDEAMSGEPDHPGTLMAYSRHLLYVDRPEQAVAALRRAQALSPLNPLVRTTLSRALAQAGRGTEALAEARAAASAHPGELFLSAFAIAIQALVSPVPELEAAARRLGEGIEAPPFAWTVLSFVLARLGQRAEALDIIDAVLLCSRTSAGEATLYAAPLASLGEFDRAAALLQQAFEQRSGMLAMVLRDPAHQGWLPQHPAGQILLRAVFGPAA
jgi:tetratricopeptide (TPR) repeat protein